MWAAVTDAVQHVSEPPGGCSLPEGPVEASDAAAITQEGQLDQPQVLARINALSPSCQRSPAQATRLSAAWCQPSCSILPPLSSAQGSMLPAQDAGLPDHLHPSSSQGHRHTHPLLPTRPVSPRLRVYHPKAPDEGGFPYSQHFVNKDFVSASRAEGSRFPEWTR